MNDKYISSENYKIAMDAMSNLNTNDYNKKLIANIVCSLKELNPNIHFDEIIERLNTLKSIEYIDFKSNNDGVQGQHCNNEIVLNASLLNNGRIHDECLIHEMMHQLSQDSGKGIMNQVTIFHPYFRYINEVITQINSYNVSEDLGLLDFPKFESWHITHKNDSEYYKNFSYYSYGYGYTPISHVGQTLMEMDKLGLSNFQEAYFNNGVNLSCRDNNDADNITIYYSLQKLEEALKKEMEISSIDELHSAKQETALAIENVKTLMILHSNDISFSDYMKMETNDKKNFVRYSDNKTMGNEIEFNYDVDSNRDIIMWGKANGIPDEKLITEIGQEHSERVNEFVRCCAILKHCYSRDDFFTEEDYKNASYCSVKKDGYDYLTIKIGGKTIEGYCKDIDEKTAVSNLYHGIEDGIYQNFGFTEQDLTKAPEIKFDSNSINRYVLAPDGSLDKLLYAASEELSLKEKSEDKVLNQNHIDKIAELIDAGKGKYLLPNINLSHIEALNDSKGVSIMQHMLSCDDNDASHIAAIKSIASNLQENNYTKFEPPIKIDIEKASLKSNTNILAEIYLENPRCLSGLIEQYGMDINFDVNRLNVISVFYLKDSRLYKDLTDDFPENHLRWFIDNGVEVDAPIYQIKNKNHKTIMSFQEYVILNGKVEDLIALAARPDFNPNFSVTSEKIIANGFFSKVEPTPLEMVFKYCKDDERLPKIKVLLENGYDINLENQAGENCLVACLQHYRMYSTDKESIKAILSYYPDRFNETEVDGFRVNANELLARTGDIRLLKEVLSDKSLNIKFDEIFNENTPESWVNQYSSEQLNELQSIQETASCEHKIESEKDFNEDFEMEF